jgi:hypothetical protein
MCGVDNRIAVPSLPHTGLAFRQIKRPQVTSRLVSIDPRGSLHDHGRCPREFGRSQKVNHIATPINPAGGGRKINVGGEGETAYLGFEDFVTEEQTFGGPLDRPLTGCLPDCCASDICLRSAPLTAFGQREIRRIARPGCRLTVASNHETIVAWGPLLISIGTVLEYVLLADERLPDEMAWAVLVVEMVK